MIPRSPGSWRLSSFRVLSTSGRSLQRFPPELHSDIVQQRGGLIAVPARLITSPSQRFPVVNDGSQRLTKLLLNVNIESSLEPVHVVMSSDNTVNDLIEAAIEIYVKEKRRPLLEETDPMFFQLHYLQFSLENKSRDRDRRRDFNANPGLKSREKLINLGSRNFLCV